MNAFDPNLQAVKDHYDTLIDLDNDPARDPEPLRAHMDKWDGPAFLDALALSPEKSVLEIGVGSGRLALWVAPRCRAFWGIDLSPKTIARAAENLADHPNVTLVEGDFMVFSPVRQFDVIYSSLTFFHLPDKAEAIRKVADLLAPGGRFVLSVDKNPAYAIDFGTHRVPLYPDTPSEILASLEKAYLILKAQFDTEFAHIFVAVKEEV